MRYVFSVTSRAETAFRRTYIDSCFGIWTTVDEDKYCIYITSFPENIHDVLFVVGHDGFVNEFLTMNRKNIKERIIVAITCNPCSILNKKNWPNKELYFAKVNNRDEAELLTGSEYGFNFDLTESELLFFRTRHNDNLTSRLEIAFTKLNEVANERNLRFI